MLGIGIGHLNDVVLVIVVVSVSRENCIKRIKETHIIETDCHLPLHLFTYHDVCSAFLGKRYQNLSDINISQIHRVELGISPDRHG